MHFIKSFVTLVLILSPLSASANGPSNGGGGDLCEDRIKTIRDDFVVWIGAGGHRGLKLSAELNAEQYASSMLLQFATSKIQCVSVGDKAYPVEVRGVSKTCRFDRAADKYMITCDLNKFLATKESDQYVLVHHEYAGLAGFEVPDQDSSVYQISNQISGYLEDKTIKKLVVKPSVNYKNICNSDSLSVDILEYIFKKSCKQITEADFLAITTVNLDNVEIKRLPINIFNGMPHLKSVTFHWVAGIYELPEDLFENNLELEYFYMSTSGFSGGATMADVLPAKFLQNKPNLQKVRFLNTRIKAIPNEAFSGANHLTSLELSWNPFLTVGSYICRGCNSLTSISFLGGSINHVSIDAFAEMPNLVAVDLRQNNLSLLEQEALIKAYPKIRFDFKFQR